MVTLSIQGLKYVHKHVSNKTWIHSQSCPANNKTALTGHA